MTPQEAVMNVIFMPTMIRSSGFYNTNTGDWTEATKIFMSILMFIGAAPNSSGGGIRITTLVLVLAALNSYGRHRKQVFMGGKAIKQEAVRRAYSVFSMGVVIVMTSIFFIVLIEKVSFITVFFEVISAFGTVGLSLGFTSTLSTASKLIIMINMFIGRIGILTFIEILDNKKETINVVAYAERDMMVG
jgi:Trk-type K+ transport system membrane component